MTDIRHKNKTKTEDSAHSTVLHLYKAGKPVTLPGHGSAPGLFTGDTAPPRRFPLFYIICGGELFVRLQTKICAFSSLGAFRPLLPKPQKRICFFSPAVQLLFFGAAAEVSSFRCSGIVSSFRCSGGVKVCFVSTAVTFGSFINHFGACVSTQFIPQAG